MIKTAPYFFIALLSAVLFCVPAYAVDLFADEPSVEVFSLFDPAGEKTPVAREIMPEPQALPDFSSLTQYGFEPPPVKRAARPAYKTYVIGSGPGLLPEPPEPSAPQVAAAHEAPPLPLRKPARKPADTLAQVAPMSAQDILAKIEPAAGRAEAAPVTPVQQEILRKVVPAQAQQTPSNNVTRVSAEPLDLSENIMSVAFFPGESGFNGDLNPGFEKKVLARALARPGESIQLHAYAAEGNEGALGARRLSLARALEIKDFLTAHNVDSSRIIVRPMGSKASGKVADKVDVVFVDLSGLL